MQPISFDNLKSGKPYWREGSVQLTSLH